MRSGLVVMALSALSFAGGCKSPPCGGSGMEIDPRPMTKAWSKNIEVPAGAVVCRAANKDEQPDSRHFQQPDTSPKKTLELYRDAMESKGWKETNVDPSKGPDDPHCTTSVAYKKGDMTAYLTVSECKGRNAPEHGWVTLNLKAE